MGQLSVSQNWSIAWLASLWTRNDQNVGDKEDCGGAKLMDLLKQSKVQSPLKPVFMLTKYLPEWKDSKHKIDGVSGPADSP